MVVMSEKKRDGFTSGLGFVLAVMGSAIGLGNIWRFPHMTGRNGGGAFVLVYLLIVFLIGAPLLLTEFVIGRHGQKNAIDSYGAISSKFKWLGYLGAFTSFPLLAYYIVGKDIGRYVKTSSEPFPYDACNLKREYCRRVTCGRQSR